MTKCTDKVMIALLLGALALCNTAFAADQEGKPQVSVGMKVWNSSWFSYLPGAYIGVDPATGAPGLADAIDAIEGERTTSVIPVIAIGKGKYVLSASYGRFSSNFNARHSSVVGPAGQNILSSRTDHLARKESDVTLAYILTPNIALSAGLKYATETRDTSVGNSRAPERLLDAKATGLIFGALGNFPISGGLRAYGQFGYGPGRVTTEGPTVSKSTSSARYLVSEIGVNYALTMADPYVKGMSVGLGFRSQVFKTSGVGPAYSDQRDYRDTKDGIVMSLSVAI